MLKGITRVLFWTYERGSWQYDIMVALILAFIFLTPPSMFDGTLFSSTSPESAPQSSPVSQPDSATESASASAVVENAEEAPPEVSE